MSVVSCARVRACVCCVCAVCARACVVCVCVCVPCVWKKPVSMARLTELRIHVEFWKTTTVIELQSVSGEVDHRWGRQAGKRSNVPASIDVVVTVSGPLEIHVESLIVWTAILSAQQRCQLRALTLQD
jgi:hypothetical protein